MKHSLFPNQPQPHQRPRRTSNGSEYCGELHYYRVVLWSHEPELWQRSSDEPWFTRLHARSTTH